MKKPPVFANIVCDKDFRPYLMVVSDGRFTTEIPVSNSSVKTVKHAAMSVYGVKPGNILVTKVEEKK